MFADRVVIYCFGGHGGSGCMSFRRETHVPRGGPNGGDGGAGGNVVIKASKDVGSLSNIVGHKHWHAARGKHGEGNQKTGRGGEDILVMVPPGTLVKDVKEGHTLKDLANDGDTLIVAQGGRGGKGNKFFATSINRAPRQFQKGEEGVRRDVLLELKLIADVGLIGKPNAGKSTLLSRLSRAQPEIANYPFTTKYPNLGLVSVGYDQQFVMADIPGLIEGAHSGVGLGHEFLRHVERTKVLIHLVEPQPMDETDPIENYRNIHEELRLYDEKLLERPEIIVITKSELPDADAVAELLAEEIGKPVMQISAVTGLGLSQLVHKVFKTLEETEGQF